MRRFLVVLLLLALTGAGWAAEEASKLGESVALAMAEFLGALGKVVSRAVDIAAESMDFEFEIEGLVEGITVSLEAAAAELEEQLPTTINFMVGSMLGVAAEALANVDYEGMDFENSEGVTVPYSWLSPEEKAQVREAFENAAEALREAAAEFE
jgi:hypothetical protein